MKLKFYSEISKCENIIIQLREFYNFILSIENIENLSDNFSDISDIAYLFDSECCVSEKDFILNRIRGRKKSRNVSSKKISVDLKIKKKSKFDILDWDYKIIAKQLTLISFNLFAKIEIKEFLNSAWTKKNKLTEASNIFKCIDRFNLLTFWVIEEILAYDDKILRARCIEKFINVALYLKEINNFNDCMNILNGLNNYIILNLIYYCYAL